MIAPAILAGLFLALIAPMLTPVVNSIFFGAGQTSARAEWGVVVHWLNLAALLAVVFFAERRGPASLGVRALRWWTIPLGLIAGLAILVLSGIVLHALQVTGDTQFAAFLQSLPFGVRLVIALTAGIIEETLYRGYALERLAVLFNSKWVAAGVTVAFFTVAHIPAVGLAHLLPVFVASLFVTALYLWRRDLVVNIIAHATVDCVGLLLSPMLSQQGG